MAAKNQGSAPTAIGLNRYVHFGFFAAGFVLAYVLIKIVESLWGLLWASNDLVVSGIAVVIAAAVTIYGWRHPRVNLLAKEIATELSKVTWPTRKETSAFTVTVVVATSIAATILWLFDMFWAALTGIVYS
jgi:preprotein translocase subunit SecE